MPETERIKYLRLALLLVGINFIFGIYPLTILWPSGWSWHAEGRSPYLEMMLGIYATLGVFLIIASRNPLAHWSLIWFTVWSSIVHGGIMAVQSFIYPHSMGHLWGDVLASFVVAAVLALLTLWGRGSGGMLSVGSASGPQINRKNNKLTSLQKRKSPNARHAPAARATPIRSSIAMRGTLTCRRTHAVVRRRGDISVLDDTSCTKRAI